MPVCYIGLGANLNDPVQQLHSALHALAELPHSRLLRVSSFYTSQPQGPQDQPNYVNAVAEIDTALPPIELLDALQQQERQQGRIKVRHWGERCIDLDILLYGNLILHTERLTLPHAQLQKRSFVVEPLRELCPQLVLPDGTALAQVKPEFIGALTKLSSDRPLKPM